MTNLACTRQGFPLVIIPSGNSAVDNITMGTNLFLLLKASSDTKSYNISIRTVSRLSHCHCVYAWVCPVCNVIFVQCIY